MFGQPSSARVPRYLVKSLQQLFENVLSDTSEYSRIKIIGFGETFIAGKEQEAKFAFNYQAPELVLFSTLGPSEDIWSLGCLVRLLLLTFSTPAD